MSFTRIASIDLTRPDADTEYSAVMDLDADLTGSFAHLNTVETSIASKMRLSLIGAPDGVASLNDAGLVPDAQIPAYPADKLPAPLGYPIGFIMLYAAESFTTAMAGVWLECNGAVLARTSYPDLFNIIGTRFGYTSSSTFKIPDLRGQFVRGWSHGTGIDPEASSRTDSGDGTVGDHVGTRQADANPSHTHQFLTYGSTMSNGDGGVGTEYYSNGQDPRAVVSSFGGNEFRPLNIAFMYIIRVV